MPAEKVAFKDRDITWISFSEWADLKWGGRVRVGVAEVNEKTPLLHAAGMHEMEWFHIHGIVVMEEGRNDEGVPWVRVLYPTKGSVLAKVEDDRPKAQVDAYSQVAE